MSLERIKKFYKTEINRIDRNAFGRPLLTTTLTRSETINKGKKTWD
jgi:hypothetical protein